jgi:hypothetical protein
MNRPHTATAASGAAIAIAALAAVLPVEREPQ